MTDKETAAIIGANIRLLRGEMSLKKLGDAVGSTAPHLWKIERAESIPGGALLKRLADFFGVWIDSLYSPTLIKAKTAAP